MDGDNFLSREAETPDLDAVDKGTDIDPTLLPASFDKLDHRAAAVFNRA